MAAAAASAVPSASTGKAGVAENAAVRARQPRRRRRRPPFLPRGRSISSCSASPISISRSASTPSGGFDRLVDGQQIAGQVQRRAASSRTHPWRAEPASRSRAVSVMKRSLTTTNGTVASAASRTVGSVARRVRRRKSRATPSFPSRAPASIPSASRPAVPARSRVRSSGACPSLRHRARCLVRSRCTSKVRRRCRSFRERAAGSRVDPIPNQRHARCAGPDGAGGAARGAVRRRSSRRCGVCALSMRSHITGARSSGEARRSTITSARSMAASDPELAPGVA